MQSFKQFLETADDTKSVSYGSAKRLSKDDAISFIDSQPGMLRAIKNGNILYRAMTTGLGNEISLIDSEGTNRISLATNNIYQIMMDASPSLSQFPSRSKSIICSTNPKGISLYGSNIYIILPVDNTPIAVSAASDFINQSIKGLADYIDLDMFSKYMGTALNNIGIKPDYKKSSGSGSYAYTDIKAIDAALAKIDLTDEEWNTITMKVDSAYSSTDVVEEVVKELKRYHRKHHSSVLSTMAKDIMTPNSLDLMLVRAGGHFPDDGREVWFSGQALAFKPLSFLTVLYALEEAGHEVSSDMAQRVRKL